jgi:MFS family permease
MASSQSAVPPTLPLSQKSQQQSLWLSVVVLFAINILNFYDRHVPGALVEPMRKEFHLNDSEIGLLGSAFIWIYAIFGVPLGRIADSASRKKLLAWGIVIWTAMTASAGLATTYAMLFFSRVGVWGRRGSLRADRDELARRSVSTDQTLSSARAFHARGASRRRTGFFL